MKTKLITAGLFFAMSAGTIQAQSQLWATTYNGSNNGNDWGQAITVDANDNVYVTGIANYGGDSKIVTIKYNSSGAQQWATVTDGTGLAATEWGTSIAFDGTYLWVAATYYNTSTYKNDLTLIRYNSSGTVQANYPKTIQDASGTTVPGGQSLLVHDGTHVYIGGNTYDGTTWKGFVAKDDVGNSGWSWTHTFNGTNTGTYSADVTDMKYYAGVTNYIYITGYVTNSNGTDCYTDQLLESTGASTGGNWPKTYNGSGNSTDASYAMYLDAFNNIVYVAGFTSTTSNGADAWIDSYTSSGGARSGFPATYNSSNNLDEKFTDIAGIGTSNCSTSLIYAGGYSVKNNTTAHDEDYILESFDISSGSTSCWTTNPVRYDGGGSTPEATGADRGYALEYSSSDNMLVITGRSDEATTGLAITTLWYSGSTGLVSGTYSNKVTYDYGSNTDQGLEDKVFWKNNLFIKYSSCYLQDFAYVVGDVWNSTSNNYDYVTLKYGSTGMCITRLASVNESEEENNATLYPNPFSETAILNVKSGIDIKDATLNIYDIMGNLISSICNIQSNSIIIKKENLSNGIYFYRLMGGEEELVKGKFAISE